MLSAPAALSIKRAIPARTEAWDGFFVFASLLHGLVLFAFPSAAVIAIGVWWNSNTISHNFIHRPFFPSPRLNRLYSLYLSLLLGIPQSLWRDLHMAHHWGREPRVRLTRNGLVEMAGVSALFVGLSFFVPSFFFGTYLPAFGVGLFLCFVHGYFEHAHGVASHYGWLYNAVFFNDGYHAEHHRFPQLHWTGLRQRTLFSARQSRLPAILRWVDLISLDSLERAILPFPVVRTWLLAAHERAFRVLPVGSSGGAPRRIGIVGGGLFPRSALVLNRIFPDAELTIIESNAEHIAIARHYPAKNFNAICEWYDPKRHVDFDLIVFPLAFRGARDLIFQASRHSDVLVHDWIWNLRKPSRIISVFLLKRLSLISRGSGLE